MATSFDNEYETPEIDKLSSLAENLVYLLPGCTDLMVRKTLQEVYRDFCRRSCCLRGRRRFELHHGDGVLAVSPIYGGFVDCVTSVKYNRMTLDTRDYDVIGGATTKVAIRKSLVPRCEEHCHPHVEISFVESPMLNSEDVPAWFIQRHGEDVCAGVLAKLMSMTGKAWSDAQQAQMNRIVYENAVSSARISFYAGGESSDGYTGMGVSAKYMI